MRKIRWIELQTKYRHIAFALMALFVLTVIVTGGFMYFESLSLFDAIYLSLMSLLTVGYGDIVPRTSAGKHFAVLAVPLGVAVVTYATGAVVSFFIEHGLSIGVWNRHMKHEVQKLEGHIIVCGFGHIGQQIYEQMKNEQVPAVYVGESEEEMAEYLSVGDLKIIGDAVNPDILEEAGVRKARGLIAAMEDDSDNVFITLTALDFNERIQVVARAERPGAENVLRRAGATRVINSSTIDGRALAMSVLNPSSIDLLNLLMTTKYKLHTLNEVIVPRNSALVGRTIREVRIRKEYNVTVMALRQTGSDEYESNPHPDSLLDAGICLMLYGEEKKIDAFKRRFHLPNCNEAIGDGLSK